MWFKYNATLDQFYYSNNSYDFFQISNGQLIRIWELKNAGTPQTTSFPYFWSKCLVLIPTPNDNPRLVWGPHPTFSATHCRIYRGVSNYPVNPLTLNYTLIATVNSSTFDYIDYAVTIQNMNSTHHFPEGRNLNI